MATADDYRLVQQRCLNSARDIAAVKTGVIAAQGYESVSKDTDAEAPVLYR